MPDGNKEKLGDNWGALAGYTPQEALRLVVSMHGELAEENKKLRQQQGGSGDSTSSPPQDDIENIKPDWNAIQQGTQEEAEKALREYSEAVFREMSTQQKKQDLESNFPTKRQQAATQAAQMLAQEGYEFSELSDELNAAMSEQNGVSKEQQVDPNNWVQAFHYLRSKLNKVATRSDPSDLYTEPVSRPSPTSRRGDKAEFESPDERHAKKMWERELGEKIPMEDWVSFRDMHTLDEYEEFVRQKRTRGKDR